MENVVNNFEAMVDKFVLDNLNLFSTTALKVREQLQKFAADLVKQTEDACKPKLTCVGSQYYPVNPLNTVSSGSIIGKVNSCQDDIGSYGSKYESSRAKDLSGLHYKDIDPR